MALISGISSAEETLKGLESLRWQNRVILVQARGQAAVNARANLEELSAGISERDIVWFVLENRELHSNYAGALDISMGEWLLHRYFGQVPDSTAVVLIGKDGGVKSRSSDLDLEGTFELIDRMPMRRREMQDRDR